MTASSIIAVTRSLTLPPSSIEVAVSAPDVGGAPAEPGFYAWWVRDGSLPQVPAPSHPTVAGWGLLYVGIAPVRSSSRQQIRARVVGNHLGGNTGSSTFRFSLAALLLSELDLHPLSRGAKTVLPPAENRALSAWQRDNLRLTWAVEPEPWAHEASVIERLEPPLNLAANYAHAFHKTVTDARAAFRSTARGSNP